MDKLFSQNYALDDELFLNNVSPDDILAWEAAAKDVWYNWPMCPGLYSRAVHDFWRRIPPDIRTERRRNTDDRLTVREQNIVATARRSAFSTSVQATLVYAVQTP